MSSRAKLSSKRSAATEYLAEPLERRVLLAITIDLMPASDTGVSSVDNITSLDNGYAGRELTFAVGGTGESGGVVIYYSTALGGPYDIGFAWATVQTTYVTTDGQFDILDGDISAFAMYYPSWPVPFISQNSPTLPITIDTADPVTPSALDLWASSDSGILSYDNDTNDATPSFAVSNAWPYFRVYDSGTRISSQYETAASSYTAPPQGHANHSYTVRSVDAAGNESADSPALSVTIRTVAPPAPAAPNLWASSDTGYSPADNITSDITPTFEVNVPQGHYRFYDSGTQISGDWEFLTTYTTPVQSASVHVFQVAAVDPAGNVSALSGLVVEIDTTAPPAPAAPDLLAESDSGASSLDNITKDTTPTFILSASPYFRFYRGSTQISNNWESGSLYTTPTQSAGAGIPFAAQAVDIAGNASALGTALPITIDNAVPTAGLYPFDHNAGPHKVAVLFSEQIDPATLTPARLDVYNLTTSLWYNPTAASYNSSNMTASFTFADVVMPDGNYHAHLSADVCDVAGNAMATAATHGFFFLGGDANRDCAVNTLDFNILAFHFGTSGKVFSQGNFNYDVPGTVNSLDFGILVSQYGKTLPAPIAELAAARPLSGLFGAVEFDDGDEQLADLFA